jgi:hypothetical protein
MKGLHYRPDFISAQEEAALIGHIRGIHILGGGDRLRGWA